MAEHLKTHAEILEENCEVPGYADPLFLKHSAHFAVYIIGCIWILLGLRVVSERYFAGAIEGLIKTYKIPASIAGATLMAAGTSTPELITSLVGVFLSSKIETGAGTVIGSIIFNQLMIVGLCILVSPGSQLSCSPVEMARDLIYYAISIGLFVYFFNDGQVTLGEAWGFVAAYIAYVIICACWTSILASILSVLGYKPAAAPAAEVIQTTEPADKLDPDVPATPRTEPDVCMAPPSGAVTSESQPEPPRFVADDAFPTTPNAPRSAPTTPGLSFQPSSLDPLPETGAVPNLSLEALPETAVLVPPVGDFDPAASEEIEGLQVEPESPHPVLDREHCPKASLLEDQDEHRHEAAAPEALHPFETSIPVESAEMRAVMGPSGVGRTASAFSESGRPSLDVQAFGVAGGFGGALLRVSLDMQRRGSNHTQDSFSFRNAGAGTGIGRPMDTIESSYEFPGSMEDLMKHPGLKHPELEPVHGHHHPEGGGGHGHEIEEELSPLEDFRLAWSGGIFSKIFFLLESVWVVAVWSTTGWFRHHKWHMCTFMVCLLWFTIHCVYLIFWLEKAGCVIGISPGVMGVVFGAAGTSIPDLLCSLFVARKGLGSMALTNVWGSNVFDLLFALGVPWVCALHVKGGTIKVQGSDSLCVWMGALLILFCVVAASCKFHFNKWHGSLFVGIYVIFIAYNFANDNMHFLKE